MLRLAAVKKSGGSVRADTNGNPVSAIEEREGDVLIVQSGCKNSTDLQVDTVRTASMISVSAVHTGAKCVTLSAKPPNTSR